MKGVILFLLCFPAFGIAQTESKILWNADSLPSWSDFKDKPPRGGEYAAETSSGIELKTSMEGGVLQISISAYFYPEDSWSKTDHQTDTIYQHEMFHFMLTEVYARKLRKELDETGSKSLEKLEKNLGTIFNRLLDELHKEQLLYDSETDHSIKYEKQLEWEAYIVEQLLALEAYKDPIISFE